MNRWWMVVLLAGAAAAGGRLPRTSPPAPQTPPASSSAPRLPQRNLTLASRSSVRNRNTSCQRVTRASPQFTEFTVGAAGRFALHTNRDPPLTSS
ncbi:unnamed protein product [Spodoptera littoralis]|uniref:Uncharacterized protein n=1 Tax=Spodoptera littoralis TaxID=7109 RepID=A0A9P0IMM5_SPOLI|nr:unnamed protein product [Spodoptera littoralis]CAH1647783.1 unnamed protein product [Spodoptera littoralis]